MDDDDDRLIMCGMPAGLWRRILAAAYAKRVTPNELLAHLVDGVAKEKIAEAVTAVITDGLCLGVCAMSVSIDRGEVRIARIDPAEFILAKDEARRREAFEAET